MVIPEINYLILIRHRFPSLSGKNFPPTKNYSNPFIKQVKAAKQKPEISPLGRWLDGWDDLQTVHFVLCNCFAIKRTFEWVEFIREPKLILQQSKELLATI
jgi:hypothetical protein